MPASPQHWLSVERVFLAAFLLCKAVLLSSTWGTAIGFDHAAHHEMVRLISEFRAPVRIDEAFYSYHPPFSFVAAVPFYRAGFPLAASVQIVSMLSSLLAFFFLRRLLIVTGLLARPEGIAFLYITVSLPIQVYLSHSTNMDVVVLGLVSMALYHSVSIAWGYTGRRKWNAIDLTLSITAAMFTKFSGVLALGLPALAYLTAPKDLRSAQHSWRRRALVTATCIATVAGFGYYAVRYGSGGNLFPSNADVYKAHDQEQARIERSRDPAGFFLGMLHAADVHATDPQNRDLEQARLTDTWRDIWRQDMGLGKMKPAAHSLSAFYVYITPWLMVAGALLWFLFPHPVPAWRRLGILLLVFGAIQVAALMKYTWDYPWPGAGLMKGIYVAPVTWLVGFTLSCLLFIPAVRRRPALLFHRTALALVFLFMVANHFLPLY